MGVIPVDGPTYRDANAALQRALNRGLDPVEELNRSGLLLTQAQRQGIQVRAMEFIRDQLEYWSPAEMLRSKFKPTYPAAPSDMYICILEWIGKHVTAVKDQP